MSQKFNKLVTLLKELFQLDQLAVERDRRAEEALAAQQRFASALAQISAMQSEHEQSAAEQRETLHADQEQMLNEIRMLASEVKALREQVSARRSADTAE